MPSNRFTPGQFHLKELVLTTQTGHKVSLDSIYASLNIYEDLFANTLSGNVLLVDGAGLIHTLPIVGEEQIEVSFQSLQPSEDDIEFKHTFDVYKIKDKNFSRQDMATYTLCFASPELKRNSQLRVSKPFLGIKASEIVTTLLTDAEPNGLGLSEIDVEETFYDEHVVIPFWTPIEAVNWLTRRVMSKENDKAVNFLFYEDKEGFHFKSLESLLQAEPVSVFAHQVLGPQGENILNNVIQYRVDESFDIYSNLKSGMYASTLTTHDLSTKQFKTYEFDYDSTFEDTAHMESNKVVSEQADVTQKPKSAFFLYPKHSGLFDNMAKDNNRVEEWLLRRNSLMKSLDNLKLIIEVKGNSRHMIGQVVEFKLLQRDPSNNRQSIPNKYYSGRYLIVAIHHSLNPLEYTQTLEIVKESFPTRMANSEGG